MSNSVVKYEAFLEIVSDLLAAGQEISFRKIHARTGGSANLISRYIKKYLDDRLVHALKPAIAVPSELVKAFNDAVARQGVLLNREIKEQLSLQDHVIREDQEINVEFLARCDDYDRDLTGIRILYDSKCRQIVAEREVAVRIEAELEKRLDEVSEQCASSRKDLSDIKVKKARLTANLENEVIARAEMEKRCVILESELKLARADLQKHQVIAAAARAEAIAGEEQLMSLHALVAQRDREVSESQERLLRAFSPQVTTKSRLAAKTLSPGQKGRTKSPKTSKPLSK